MSSDSCRVTLGTEAIEYEVTESPDATEPRIDVDIHGVTVVLPEGDNTDPERLLHENYRWVLDKREKYERYREQAPERDFEAGETFPYLGAPHEVIVERRPTSEVAEDELCLAQHHVEQTSIQQALESLYRRKARERFEDRADHFVAQMDVEYEEIEIRNQRTKWGSCSSTGTLGLNWRLLMAPPEIIDYVVIHELAHLREPNHTKEFWRIVNKYDSDYSTHAEWLDNNSTQLIFTEDDL
jgi:predicted metal-dependent hydrolase